MTAEDPDLEMLARVRHAVANAPINAVRDLLCDLADADDDIPENDSDAREMLVGLTYDSGDPEGTEAHCRIVASLG